MEPMSGDFNSPILWGRLFAEGPRFNLSAPVKRAYVGDVLLNDLGERDAMSFCVVDEKAVMLFGLDPTDGRLGFLN